ncbi:MAG: hypothetical protein N3D16_00960 [Anaerolineales bacterium]|nr:hypothetical protein [Anaerolineales bacterium]
MESKLGNLDRFWLRVILKGVLFFTGFNIFFAIYDFDYGKFSVYNHLFPGRFRLPYSDQPAESYNVTITNLDAMFASHLIAGSPKAPNEYRVLLIGDSATWGYLLPPDQTLAAHLNQANLRTPDNKAVVFYNLGYPVMSLLKDALILDRGLTYQPDLVLWLVTLESFPMEKQLFSPLLEKNPREVIRLIEKLSLSQTIPPPQLPPTTFWQRSLFGQRKALADWIRFQIYGFLWTATGVDHHIPEQIPEKQVDLSDEQNYYSQEPPNLRHDQLAFEVINATIRISAPTPIILINEPMFISSGLNSEIRYNFYYPRWAYDQYRELLVKFCQYQSLTCWDIWNLISPEEFTNTAIHMTSQGTPKLRNGSPML